MKERQAAREGLVRVVAADGCTAMALGLVIIIFGLWLTRAPALILLFGSVIFYAFLAVLAMRDLRRGALDPAVLKLALGLWSVGLALWFSLPRLYGISIVICVLPIVLAAAYVRREKALQIAVGG